MITNWYHKPIASNRQINFYSNHPAKMKMNVAKSFIQKIFRLSHKQFWSENLQRIHDILKKNNYPKQLICKLINEVINTKTIANNTSYRFLSHGDSMIDTNTNQSNTTLSPNNQYASLANGPELSESIS